MLIVILGYRVNYPNDVSSCLAITTRYVVSRAYVCRQTLARTPCRRGVRPPPRVGQHPDYGILLGNSMTLHNAPWPASIAAMACLNPYTTQPFTCTKSTRPTVLCFSARHAADLHHCEHCTRLRFHRSKATYSSCRASQLYWCSTAGASNSTSTPPVRSMSFSAACVTSCRATPAAAACASPSCPTA